MSVDKSEVPVPDPFDAFSEGLQADLVTLFRQLVWEMPFEAVKTRMAPFHFNRLARLVVADEWWADRYTDEELAEKILARPDELCEWRKSPGYAEIRHLALAGMETIQQHDTAEELIANPRFQTRVLRETAQLMTTSKNPWIKQKAGQALLDRMAPTLTKGRDAGPGAVMVLSDEQFGELKEAFRESRRLDGRMIDVTPDSEVHAGPAAIPARASGE